ncbi:hypothetical protein [Shewanella woodyi]|uniref:Lipoprotein n=1 Tax=Shewanella woodyi (strain ATCC 51908 / MS32) TaxID=392500 RepID=B1KDC0_SHEWM|nr:hypothetical protein [Shewanella woodyi]ACA84921.1 conserved hypothetical protein [Shewanella woodyi ATCC 51908]
MKTWKISFLSLLLLSACSNLTFRTHISPEIGDVAARSIAASDVREFSVEEMSRREKEFLGEIRSSYCQAGLSKPSPSRSLLATDLRYKTVGLGGNGYTVMECFDSNAGCNAYLECRALAYTVRDGSL